MRDLQIGEGLAALTVVAALFAAGGCMRVEGGDDQPERGADKIVGALQNVGAKVEEAQNENRSSFERITSALGRISGQPIGGPASENSEHADAAASKAPDKESAARYTGAIVYVRTDGSCPYCDRLVGDLKARTKDGWRIGPGETDHFKIVDAASQQIPTPTVVYYKDGKVVGKIVGYGGTPGELNAILIKHPAHNPQRPFATGVTTAGTSRSVEAYLLDVEHHAPAATVRTYAAPPLFSFDGVVSDRATFEAPSCDGLVFDGFAFGLQCPPGTCR